MFKHILSIALAGVLGLTTAVQAEELTDVNEIVKKANVASYYRGDDGRSDAPYAD